MEKNRTDEKEKEKATERDSSIPPGLIFCKAVEWHLFYLYSHRGRRWPKPGHSTTLKHSIKEKRECVTDIERGRDSRAGQYGPKIVL